MHAELHVTLPLQFSLYLGQHAYFAIIYVHPNTVQQQQQCVLKNS